MISSTPHLILCFEQHITSLMSCDLRVEYQFPYLGKNHNVQSLIGTLSLYIFHRKGMCFYKNAIKEHSRLLLSSRKVTVLVEKFAQDEKMPSFFRAIAHFILGETYLSEFARDEHYFRLDAVTRKKYAQSKANWAKQSMLHYCEALSEFDKWREGRSLLFFSSDDLSRPTIVVTAQMMLLLTHPKAQACMGEWEKSFDLIKTLFSAFDQTVVDNYLPALRTIIDLNKRFPVCNEAECASMEAIHHKYHLSENRMSAEDAERVCQFWQGTKDKLFFFATRSLRVGSQSSGEPPHAQKGSISFLIHPS